ncbi:chaperonin CPN60-2, mitochondrial [Iris pallida]|uniref:Chaperonin CPN60-2, mitochondrial n=1 Tax=Iris pallida TaxID=29817 RepID=A0AAX6GKG9_IRIPA|nr:chaperonin CPN60-2, mitochondrial [Iris pallida]
MDDMIPVKMSKVQNLAAGCCCRLMLIGGGFMLQEHLHGHKYDTLWSKALILGSQGFLEYNLGVLLFLFFFFYVPFARIFV